MPALLIIGVLLILGGLTLLVVWIEYLWALIKALLPIGVIGVGGILAYFGWEERKESRGSYLDFSSPTEASRYQAEALAYQEKLSGFQDESLASSPVDSQGSESQGIYSFNQQDPANIVKEEVLVTEPSPLSEEPIDSQTDNEEEKNKVILEETLPSPDKTSILGGSVDSVETEAPSENPQETAQEVKLDETALSLEKKEGDD